MELLTILSFLGAAIILTLAPGPDNLFVLAQSIAKGKNAGIFTTFGLSTGLLVHIAAATLGISAIIYHSTFAFTVIKYAGAAYLLYLAYKSFVEKDGHLNLKAEDSLDHSSLYKKGIIMNLLNPKVSLFFLAFFHNLLTTNMGMCRFKCLFLAFYSSFKHLSSLH